PLQAAARLDAALRLVLRQRVGGHHLGVIDTADDDRPIRVAFQEGDHDLLADAGPEEGPPALARPRLGDADPAGVGAGLLVLGVAAVPEKPHLDPAVLVGEDLLPLHAVAADHGR